MPTARCIRRSGRCLESVCARLRFPAGELERLEAMVRAEHRARSGKPSDALSAADAYAILGVDESCSDAELKLAYRRMMNRHHPDKLVAKGLPEEMMRVATEKTREIKAAYESAQGGACPLRQAVAETVEAVGRSRP